MAKNLWKNQLDLLEMLMGLVSHSIIHQTLATAPGAGVSWVMLETQEKQLELEQPQPGGEMGHKESPRQEHSQP